MISIIIPTYNRANCIKRAVESILQQTYKDFELIIVDDNSTDNTDELILAIDDKRIKYHKLEKNGGACRARNIGIQMAKGEYIAFQDSDDLWYPEKLEAQVKAFEQNKGYDMVFCSFKRDYGKSKIVPSPELKETSGMIFHSLVKGNFVGTITILCKREVLEDLGGFDEAFPAMQDWELSLRISQKYKIYHLKEVLVEAEISEDSITKNKDKVLQAWDLLIEKYKETLNRKELKEWKFKKADLALKGGYRSMAIEIFKSIMDLYSKVGIVAFINYLKLTLNHNK